MEGYYKKQDLVFEESKEEIDDDYSDDSLFNLNYSRP